MSPASWPIFRDKRVSKNIPNYYPATPAGRALKATTVVFGNSPACRTSSTPSGNWPADQVNIAGGAAYLADHFNIYS
jgi:hypothetical protein